MLWLEFGGIESHGIVYILVFIRHSYYAFRAQMNALLEESIQVSAFGCYLRALGSETVSNIPPNYYFKPLLLPQQVILRTSVIFKLVVMAVVRYGAALSKIAPF